ncbi:unnamed protein product [Ectocarpus sp. 12 AP-2014]
MHANEICVYHRCTAVFLCGGTLNNRVAITRAGYAVALCIGVILDFVKTEVAVGVTWTVIEDRHALSLVEQTDHDVHVDDCRPDQASKSCSPCRVVRWPRERAVAE